MPLNAAAPSDKQSFSLFLDYLVTVFHYIYASYPVIQCNCNQECENPLPHTHSGISTSDLFLHLQ